MCTLALFFMLFAALSLQAEISPVTLTKDMKKIPSQHAAACNGSGGYPLRIRARIANGDKYPGGGDCKTRMPLPLKTPSTQGVTGQRHPLQFILEYLYVEDDRSL